MAQMRTLKPHAIFNGVPMTQIADVFMPVGRDAENNLTDVQLVQFLLQFAIEFFKHSPKGPMRRRNGREITEVSVDGICGPATREAIAAFQRRVIVSSGDPRSVVVDGRVSPTLGTAVSTTDNAFFTIVWLNQVRRQVVGTDLDPEDLMVQPLGLVLSATQPNIAAHSL